MEGHVSHEKTLKATASDPLIVADMDVVLRGDLLTHILSFLYWADLMKCRCVCQTWKQHVLEVPVPELFVCTRYTAGLLEVIARALPNLSALQFDQGSIDSEKFHVTDSVFRRAQGFRRLKHLTMIQTHLYASAPQIWQSYTHLIHLDLRWNVNLQWNLSNLAALPKLEKLYCAQNRMLTGDLRSLRVLSNTLVVCDLLYCAKVTGALNDLAHMSRLVELDLYGTRVTGDLRTIGDGDFVALKKLKVGFPVYGGIDVPRISDAEDYMRARYRLMHRIPNLFTSRLVLCEESPDWYDHRGFHYRVPPFWIEFVKCGSRIGWRWTNCLAVGTCDIHWLEPEPCENDPGFREYAKAVQDEMGAPNRIFPGFLNPPSQQEYRTMFQLDLFGVAMVEDGQENGLDI